MDIALLNPAGSLYITKWIHLLFILFWLSHIINYNYYFNKTLTFLSQEQLVSIIKSVFPSVRLFLIIASLGSVFTGTYLLAFRANQFGKESLFSSWGICVLITFIISIFMLFNDIFITQKNYKKLVNFTSSSQEFNIDHNFLMSLVGKISNIQKVNYIYLIVASFFVAGSVAYQ